uniref:Uncharacterized protein n=1 Tax=Haemonchus contortus TaxID=6289 RepID=A0A7I4Y1J5_HAECO
MEKADRQTGRRIRTHTDRRSRVDQGRTDRYRGTGTSRDTQRARTDRHGQTEGHGRTEGDRHVQRESTRTDADKHRQGHGMQKHGQNTHKDKRDKPVEQSIRPCRSSLFITVTSLDHDRPFGSEKDQVKVR